MHRCNLLGVDIVLKRYFSPKYKIYRVLTAMDVFSCNQLTVYIQRCGELYIYLHDNLMVSCKAVAGYKVINSRRTSVSVSVAHDRHK